MTFLQKLESLYGGLIRLLTAVLTLALLAVAATTLVNWQRATATEPEAKAAATQVAPTISGDDLVKRVIASQGGKPDNGISADDPNRAAYERMSKAIDAFARKHEVSKEDADVDSVLSTIHDNVNYFDADAMKAAYANGLADALERTLTDAKVEALLNPPAAKKDDAWSSDEDVTPMGIVNDAVSQYDAAFTKQANRDDSDATGAVAHKEKQDAAWRSLLRAGGPLLLLILVLQLLTFGRIEQNTRTLTGQSKQAN
ncbi:hypothetical protein [Dyella sp. ASV21]|jgi:hypothetical protein|uniref:hypothetical protein n=1 Tax=Dyella sp. ASV21 TaxID=2795114 RepID=UPI0018ED47B9|nr:hypothetical protein [Dyella sp. ASV21]